MNTKIFFLPSLFFLLSYRLPAMIPTGIRCVKEVPVDPQTHELVGTCYSGNIITCRYQLDQNSYSASIQYTHGETQNIEAPALWYTALQRKLTEQQLTVIKNINDE